MYSVDQNEYGVYNINTKELFRFDTYEQAFSGYMMLINDYAREHKCRLPDDWYIVTINSNKIIQLEKFSLDMTCKAIEL